MNDNNMPTMTGQRTPQRPRRRSTGCVTRGCLAVFTLAVVIIVGGVIAGPLVFRLLPSQYQNGIARRVPALSVWLPSETPAPTRSYTADFLPTADSAQAAAAMNLLNTPAGLPSAVPTLDPPNQPASQQPQTQPVTGAAIAAASSPSPTSVPSDIPATS